MASQKSSAPATADSAGTAAPAATRPRKRGRIITILLVMAGLALGGGSATAYFLITGGIAKPAMAKAARPVVAERDLKDPIDFIDVQRLMVPLYQPDDTLQRYVSIDIALEVRSSNKDFVQQRIALVRHAINRMGNTTDLRDPKHLERLDFNRAAALMLSATNTALAPSTDLVQSVSIVNAMPL